MFGDSKNNSGQWEVVGGKDKVKPSKSKSPGSGKNGTAGAKKSAGNPPVLKVDELGELQFLLLLS